MAAEHLVRWKYQANTTLNKNDVDTHWYSQTYSDKDAAITQYISLLKSEVGGLVVEIYRLTRLSKL